jgi:hypothetical protein
MMSASSKVLWFKNQDHWTQRGEWTACWVCLLSYPADGSWNICRRIGVEFEIQVGVRKKMKNQLNWENWKKKTKKTKS